LGRTGVRVDPDFQGQPPRANRWIPGALAESIGEDVAIAELYRRSTPDARHRPTPGERYVNPSRLSGYGAGSERIGPFGHERASAGLEKSAFALIISHQVAKSNRKSRVMAKKSAFKYLIALKYNLYW
jgi:hypothetical protein